ncbi:heterokaryon incompatibility protein-domain-containing protein [Colletotrichum godetiae]|uniref:Heterokaryon incompatibility protein-domain-containing protein n=1 Tax=Colletotrichum godetiae TaxID=1209918 RepID=A0AAJ0EUV4_9PEZI|nr:heterokaryon incompatibility protein-domain-containing protein [Colletotrichum godetiae]KAK1672640.1 heterokaryon incompatibility protein-domain-containing protein [Colletotrichum godetiae]
MLPRTKRPEAVSFGGLASATNLPRVAQLVQERQQANPNPRLCERCQDWDVPDFAAGLGSKSHHYVSLESISFRSLKCLLCRAVAAAVEARRREDGCLRDCSEAYLFVTLQGPFFLDSGLAEDQKYRLFASSSDEVSVRLFLELTLSTVRDKSKLATWDALPSPFAVTPQFLFRYSTEEPQRLQTIEEWEAEYFDVETLKIWIDGCEILHGHHCVTRYKSIDHLPIGFRVIDVRGMKIVKPSRPVRFVALSYMWEASEASGHAQLETTNAEDLEAPGSLESVKLPRIILDAISLCRDLGEGFLWVDRLCIVQDDERSKPDQIDGMDRIYQSASFSILAALNDRRGNGFPGYAGNPRRRRASLWCPPRNRNVGKGIDPNGLHTVVDASLWNQRGWTFQERLLSRRSIFITEHQVLFQCCRGHAAEELTWGRARHEVPTPLPSEDAEPTQAEDHIDEHDSQAHHATQIDIDESTTEKKTHHIPNITGFYRRALHNRDAPVKLRGQVSLANYCQWVEDYTSRQLSRETDILNAFAGVGNAVGDSMRTKMMFGLPEMYLPQTLMWSHTGAVRRRGDAGLKIPSWSWAAWSSVDGGSAASYRWIHGDARLFDTKLVRIVTLVQIYVHDARRAASRSRDDDYGLRKARVTERWLGSCMQLAKINGIEKLPPLQRKMAGGKFNVSEETNEKYTAMWRECPHSPWEALAHAELDPEAVEVAAGFPGALVFNTTVASLRVGRDRRMMGARRGDCEDAEILDMMGRHVGYLDKMDTRWISGRKGARDRRMLLDFIVVSASVDTEVSESTEWAFIKGQFHEMWRFNVMLVERVLGTPFVARRVGVGYVWLSQWKDCYPRWETVVLC